MVRGGSLWAILADLKHPPHQVALTLVHMFPARMIRARAVEKRACMSRHVAKRSPCGSRIRAFKAFSLHFSPRGEAKWVRGPSGLGASRAEEKGARRKPARIPRFSRITRHETRLFFRNTAFPVARMVPVGTEALQSCFFRSGMHGIGREEPLLRSRDAKIRGANVSNEKG